MKSSIRLPDWLVTLVKMYSDQKNSNKFPPGKKLGDQKGDIIHGKVPDYLRPMFSTAIVWRLAARETLTKINLLGKKADPRDIEAYSCMLSKAEITERIFWHTIREECNLWNKPHLAIGEGWLIVEVTDKRSEILHRSNQTVLNSPRDSKIH